MSGPVQFSFANVEGEAAANSVLADFGDLSDAPREELLESAPVQARATPQTRSINSSTSKPLNVLKLAKARLREVKKELKRMQALEQERIELERLIAAASTPLT